MFAADSDPDDTLDLDPEWGGVDLAESVEATFGFQATPEEAASCATVGDLHALILRHVARQPGKCATSMTFYRLRRAIQPDGTRIGPDTSLAPFVRSGAKAFRRQLETDTGLRLPRMQASWPSGVGLALVLLFVILAGWSTFVGSIPAGIGAAAALIIAVLLFASDPLALPPDCRTLGGLAREAAPRNFGKLASEGAAVDDGGVWETLKTLLVEDCEADPKRIRPSATLFRP